MVQQKNDKNVPQNQQPKKKQHPQQPKNKEQNGSLQKTDVVENVAKVERREVNGRHTPQSNQEPDNSQKQLSSELEKRNKLIEEQVKQIKQLQSNAQNQTNEKDVQELERQLAGHKSLQITNLSVIDDLKRKLSNEQAQHDQQMQEQINKTIHFEHIIHDQQMQLQHFNRQFQLRHEETTAMLHDIQYYKSEFQHYQQLLSDRESELATAVKQHAEEIENLKSTLQAQIQEKNIENDRLMQELTTARDNVSYMEQERNKSKTTGEHAQHLYEALRQSLEFKTAELHHTLQDMQRAIHEAPRCLFAKYEEDVLFEVAMKPNTNKDEANLKRLVQIFQLLDFYDSDRAPNGHYRISGSNALEAFKEERKNKYTHQQYEAYKFLSRTLRGTSSTTASRDLASIDGAHKLQKLIHQSDEEIAPGVTYQELSDMIQDMYTCETFHSTPSSSSSSSLTSNGAFDPSLPYVISSNAPNTSAGNTASNNGSAGAAALESNAQVGSPTKTATATTGASTGATSPKQDEMSYTNDYEVQYNVTLLTPNQQISESDALSPREKNNTSRQQQRRYQKDLDNEEGSQENGYLPRKHYNGPRRGRGNARGRGQRGRGRGGFAQNANYEVHAGTNGTA